MSGLKEGRECEGLVRRFLGARVQARVFNTGRGRNNHLPGATARSCVYTSSNTAAALQLGRSGLPVPGLRLLGLDLPCRLGLLRLLLLRVRMLLWRRPLLLRRLRGHRGADAHAPLQHLVVLPQGRRRCCPSLSLLERLRGHRGAHDHPGGSRLEGALLRLLRRLRGHARLHHLVALPQGSRRLRRGLLQWLRGHRGAHDRAPLRRLVALRQGSLSWPPILLLLLLLRLSWLLLGLVVKKRVGKIQSQMSAEPND